MFPIDRSGRIVWVNDSCQRFLPALGLLFVLSVCYFPTGVVGRLRSRP